MGTAAAASGFGVGARIATIAAAVVGTGVGGALLVGAAGDGGTAEIDPASEAPALDVERTADTVPLDFRGWIDAPLHGAELALDPVAVTAHATSPAEVVALEFVVNGEVVDLAESGGSLRRIEGEWSPPAPGTYTLALRGEDGAGRSGELARGTVFVRENAATSPTTPDSSTTTSTTSSTSSTSSTSTPAPTTTPGSSTSTTPGSTTIPATTPTTTAPSSSTPTTAPPTLSVTTTPTAAPPSSSTTTPGDTTPPRFLRVSASPGVFFQGDTDCGSNSVSATAVVEDASGIASVTLHHRMIIPGVDTDPPVSTTAMTAIGSDSWRVTLAASTFPAFPPRLMTTGTWEFYVVARDQAGNPATSDTDTSVRMERC